MEEFIGDGLSQGFERVARAPMRFGKRFGVRYGKREPMRFGKRDYEAPSFMNYYDDDYVVRGDYI